MTESLIALCKSEDPKAQRELYEAFSGKMFRICYRYLRHQMDAEDMLINGFVKIFKNMPALDYRSKEATEAWMKKIMVNECLMFLRKKRNLSFSQETIENSIESAVLPIDELDAEEIYATILQLPQGYRTVFNLYEIEGFTHKEIASQLGITENTSKSQLFKAKITLRQMLIRKGVLYEK